MMVLVIRVIVIIMKVLLVNMTIMGSDNDKSANIDDGNGNVVIVL